MKRNSHTHRQASRTCRKAVRCEPLEQRQLLAAAPVIQQFDGISIDHQLVANGGLFPLSEAANPSSAVGPNHVVSVTTSTIQWTAKDGTSPVLERLGRNVAGSTVGSFFQILDPQTVVASPKVIFDQHENRFVVMGLDRTLTASGGAANTSRILVAVSDDADPVGVWHYASIDSKVVKPFIGEYFTSSPGLAANAEALYITADLLSFSDLSFGGPRLWVVQKSGFYAGSTPVVAQRDPFQNEPSTPKISLQPTHMFESSPVWNGGPIGILVGTRHELPSLPGVETLTFFAVQNPSTNPSIVRINIWDVANIDDALQALPGAPQFGYSGLISTGQKRIESAVYRDGSLWSCSTVVPGSGPDAGKATVHWYKSDFNSPVVALRTADHGSVSGQAIAPGTHTFFPSIMVDAVGDVAMTFSASGPNIFPGAYYTTRLATDAPGTVQPPAPLAQGSDAYEQTVTEPDNLFGQSSSISLDPSDSMSMWMYNSYALPRLGPPAILRGRWGTRHGRVTHLGSVSGTVFRDTNGNGFFEAGELPLSGATVFVDLNKDGALGAGEPSAVTPADGTYSFSNLVAGNYNIVQLSLPGLFASNSPRAATVGGGGTTQFVNMANVATVHTDSGASSNYLLRKNVGSTQLEILINGMLAHTLPANVPALTFNLGGGDDSLTIDYVNGSPIPLNGVNFDGGEGADALVISGGPSGDRFDLMDNGIYIPDLLRLLVGYGNVESLAMNTGGGDDVVQVDSFPASVSVVISGGADDDFVSVTNLFQGTVTVNGGTGSDTITFEGAPGGDTIYAWANAIQGATADVLMPSADFESPVIRGGGTVNNYYVYETAPGAPLTINGSVGTDAVYLSSIDGGHYAAPLTFHGGAGADELHLVDTSSPGGSTFVVSPTQVSKNNGFAGATYSALEYVYIDDGTASTAMTTFQVDNTASNFGLLIDGGNFADAYLVFETGANAFVGITSAPGGDFIAVNGDHNGSALVRQMTPLLAPAALYVSPGGTLYVDPGGNKVLRPGSLSMNPTGTIDLTDNTMILDYASGETSPLSLVQTLLTAGYNAGAWNGGGIRSSTAAATPNRALGFAEATDIGSPSTFAGQSIDNTAVLVRYTISGDADLNRTVDVNDLGILASNWQQSPRRWSQGNFDYSENGVDVNDLGILASNWQASIAGAGSASGAAPAMPFRTNSPTRTRLVQDVISLLEG